MNVFLKLFLSILVCLTFGGHVHSQENFQLGKFSAKRGERTDLILNVPVGDKDPATFIPLTVIRGMSDGPTLLMVAGVHGFEFSPILAADRLTREISPSDLQGTLVIVRIAHVSSFENRTPYVNPFDRKNLNRSFPGSVDGTQTERIAHVLSSVIIPTADFVFDVHSGDGAEWLEAFVGVYGGPLASDYETALGVAQSMSFPNIVRYKMNTQKQVDTGRSLNRQAVAQGLPTVLVEVGQNGSRNGEDVELIVSGMRSAMAFLGMLSDNPTFNAIAPRYFDGTQSVPVESAGLWTPSRRAGPVEKDEVLGILRGFTDDSLETIKAPASGYAIYGLEGPPVRSGESVMTIAKPIESLD